MEGLEFGGIQSHALCSENSTIEGNMRLPDPTVLAVKDLPCCFGHLHQLKEVSAMVLGGTAIDAYIIVYCNNAGETVCCLVHLHLKDILGHP